jgi:hypothetical protein
MSHPHGINCIHICGFNPARWCAECRASWEQHAAIALATLPPDGPTEAERRAIIDTYRLMANTTLASVVLSEIERGDLPAPLGFPAPESIGPRLRAAAEPSAN